MLVFTLHAILLLLLLPPGDEAAAAAGNVEGAQSLFGRGTYAYQLPPADHREVR